MPLDPARLLAYPIPRATQIVSPRDAAFYALSVGLAQDPVDERQLAFVDPDRGPALMPSWALVMAHPGFWLGDPATGVDPASVLHAEQAIELLAPLPCEGRITSESRITGLIDKGVGKAALLITETLLRNEAGANVARLERTTFLRGAGGFRDDARPSDPPVTMPDRRPDHVIDLATRPEQALFYRLNGDLNPLHASPALAARAGFERPILHGLCTAGVICHALLRALVDYDARRLSGFRLRFSGPVYPGETIRTEVWSEGAFRARVIERDAAVIDGGMAKLALLNTQPELAA